LVSEPLPLLYAQHLTRDRRRSAHTVRAYQATAERLIAFLQEHWGEPATSEALAKVSAADLRAFLARRRGEGLVNASAARELSAVRGFLKFAVGEQAELPRLRGPRVKKGHSRARSRRTRPSRWPRLCPRSGEPWIGARDWAVLLLLYGAGLRIGEAVGLTGAILPLGATMRVTGKRAKTRIVPLLPQVRDAIEAYAKLCPWRTARDAPLFRGAKGGPLPPGDDPQGGARRRAPRSASRNGPRRMRCATASRRICWGAARICARCRNCSAMPASARPRSTPRSMRRICSTSIATRIPRA
jgi:integrase/recombinase XerC